METMEELLMQKKEIEEKIKALKDEELSFGRVKMTSKQFPPNRPQYAISLKIPHYYIGNLQERWYKIIEGDTKADAVNQLPDIIADMQKMYDYYKEKKQ